MNNSPIDFTVGVEGKSVKGTLTPLAEGPLPHRFKVVIEKAQDIGVLEYIRDKWTFNDGNNPALAEALGHFIFEWYE